MMTLPISIGVNHKCLTETDINNNLLECIETLAIHQREYTPLEKCTILGHIEKIMKRMPIYVGTVVSPPSPQYRLLHLNEKERYKYLAHVIDMPRNINSIFCTVCVLFGKGTVAMRTNGVNISTYTVTNKCISSHEKSKAHLEAFKLYTDYNELKLGMLFRLCVKNSDTFRKCTVELKSTIKKLL